MPPQDVRYTLEIDFLDAVNGTHKMVAMPDGKTLDMTIPAGINDGQVLRLKGQGIARFRRQAGGRVRRDLGSAALRLQARGT